MPEETLTVVALTVGAVKVPGIVRLPAPDNVIAKLLPPYHLKAVFTVGTEFHSVLPSMPIA